MEIRSSASGGQRRVGKRPLDLYDRRAQSASFAWETTMPAFDAYTQLAGPPVQQGTFAFLVEETDSPTLSGCAQSGEISRSRWVFTPSESGQFRTRVR